MFKDRNFSKKEENQTYVMKRTISNKKTQIETNKNANINNSDRNLNDACDKVSSSSNSSSSSSSCVRSVNTSKEKKIQSLHEMAMRLTETLAKEEEAIDKKLESLQNKTSNSTARTNIKVSNIHRKTSDFDNLSVEEVITKLKNILPDPKIKATSQTNLFSSIPNNMFIKTVDSDLDSRFYKSGQYQIGVSQLRFSSDPVKLKGSKSVITPRVLNSVETSNSSAKNQFSNVFKNSRNRYSLEEINAATIIQAYYRGYCVRKITSSLLKTHIHNYKRLKSNKIYNQPFKVIPAPQTVKTYDHSAILPKHIKPFYDLAESGDINSFTDSYLRIKSKNCAIKETRMLSDSEKECLKIPNSVYSSQSSRNSKNYSNSSSAARSSIKNNSDGNEIDLKNFCSNKIFGSNISIIPTQDKSNIHEEVLSMNNILNKGNGRENKFSNQNSFYHISNGSNQNNNVYSSHTSVATSLPCSSLNATDVSNTSHSLSNLKPLDDKCKNYIPTKDMNTVMVSPSHLRSKINAELVFQDTIGSALSHLQDLQNIKALSSTQELNINHKIQEAENLPINHKKFIDKCINTDTYSLTDELQINHYKKKFQDDFEKVEKEAQMRILKLQQNLKNEVEKIFKSASKSASAKFDPRICDALPLNKYSDSKTESDSSSKSQELATSHKSLKPSKSDLSNISDFSMHPIEKSVINHISLTNTDDEALLQENTLKPQIDVQSSDIQVDKIPLKYQENLDDSSDMCDLKIYKSGKLSKSTYSHSSIESGDKQFHSKLMSSEEVFESHMSDTSVKKNITDPLTSKSKSSDVQIVSELGLCQPSSSLHDQKGNSLVLNERLPQNKLPDNNQQPAITSNSQNGNVNKSLESEKCSYAKTNENKNIFNSLESHMKSIKDPDETLGSYSDLIDSGGNIDFSLDPEEQSLLSSAEEKDQTGLHTIQKHREKVNEETAEDTSKNARGGALQSMLNLLVSLQKEEEISFKHQLAVFKLQEQFLIEEARLKLISANSEGGVNLRKRQRAIFLQLREQRSHIKRLIETQKLAAQQRQLFFNQHHNIILSTSNPTLRLIPSRTHSPLSHNLELSSSDDFENSSSTSSFSKGLRKIGLQPLHKEDSNFKNKHDILATSSLKEEVVPKQSLSYKKELLRRKEETGKKDNLKYLNYEKIYARKSDESDTSELETLKRSVTKSSSYQSVNISSKDQKVRENIMKDVGLNSSINNQEDRNSNKNVHNTQYFSNSRTVAKVDEIDLVLGNNRLDKGKSGTELKAIANLCDAKDNTQSEKIKRKQTSSLPFALRNPLHPRSPVHYRRQSSESDDSFNLSQNDTISDISDYESRLGALREELVLRKTEAERLKKERRRLIKERILSQEQALRNQIAVYDSFIEQKKQEIEIESQKLLKVSSVKPLIKKPHAYPAKVHHNESLSISESICNENIIDESVISDNTSANISNDSYLGNSLSGIHDGSVEAKPDLNAKVEASVEISNAIDRSNHELSYSALEHLSFADEREQIKELVKTTCVPELKTVIVRNEREEQQQLRKPTAQELPQKPQVQELPQKPQVQELPQKLQVQELSQKPQAQELSQKSQIHQQLGKPQETQISQKHHELQKEQTHQKQQLQTPQAQQQQQELQIQRPQKELQPEIITLDIGMEFSHIEEEKSDLGEIKSVNITSLDIDKIDNIAKIDFEDKKSEILLDESKTHIHREKDVETSASVEIQRGDDLKIVTTDDKEETQVVRVHSEKIDLKLKKKANNLADYILDSLVNDSILCMKSLLRNKNKSQVIIFDIIGQSDDLLVGSEAVGKDFEAFVKTKITVQDNVSPLQVDYIPATVESIAGEKRILQKSNIEGTEERLDNQSSWFDEPNRVFPNYNGPSEFYKGTEINETFSVSSYEGVWLEGDFWKPEDNNLKTQELKEAEELINAEIARLEELQRFKEKYPNLVIREVPDKPPPPYTPPKDVATSTAPEELKLPEPQTPSNTISVPHRLSKADLRKIASDIVNVVPAKDELISTVENHCDHLYFEWQKGINPAAVEYPALISIKAMDSEEVDPSETSEAAFSYLIFNLTRQYVCEVFDYIHAPPPKIWETHFHNPKKRNWKISKSANKSSVANHVVKNVRSDLGIDPSSKRESAMIKWALKKREPVDQIIVQEFQTEEQSWVQYFEEEVYVKTQISKEIFSSLIDDTISVFKNILSRRL